MKTNWLAYGALVVVCLIGIAKMLTSNFTLGIPTFVVGVVFIGLCRKIGM